MKNPLIPVGEFLNRAAAAPRALERTELRNQAPAINYAADKNNAFISAVCRRHEFADHDCIVLALVGPNGGTRGLGALSLEQARDLQGQLSEAIRRLSR